MEHKAKVIDLFAGCGGFSVGFKRAGFEIVKAVEFDNEIALSYIHNHKNTLMYAEDISKIVDGDHFKNGEAEIIIGGPPCQGFSMAGARIREKNAFINDPRNFLFRHYVNVVRIVRPKIFVFENVKGILSKDGGKIFQEIVNAFGNPENFDGDRYYLHYKVCKAVEFGIPQKRERVILLGVLNHDFDIERVFSMVRTTMTESYPQFFDSVTLFDAISDIPLPSADGVVKLYKAKTNYQKQLRNNSGITYNHIATKHNNLAMGRMEKVSAGQNWTVLDEKINSVHSGAYGRLEWNSPTMTITTRFDTPAGGRFIHPNYNRTITPREAARIQSFPDSFEFTGSKTSICKQIGNAVPPKLAFFIANVVNVLLNDGKIK